MSDQVQAYPLQWPAGVARTKRRYVDRARFSSYGKPITLTEAARRLYEEMDRLDGQSVVLSSNVELRLDGQPRGGAREPDDHGVACYWIQDGEQRCIPCDRWDRVADNVAAIAKAINALRGLDRWVNDSVVAAAFTGFAALPSPSGSPVSWRDVLGFSVDQAVTREQVRDHYKRAASRAHPDREGGSEEQMQRVNQARLDALMELANG